MKKIAFLLFVFIAFSCKKKAVQQSANPVPSIPVSITVYPNDPLYFKIQSIGGWMIYPYGGGVNGIILYRKSEQEFVAIERTSSYLPTNPKAIVQVMSDNFTLRDTISNSHWRIFDGVVTQGPASWALRLYGTVYDGNSLFIKN